MSPLPQECLQQCLGYLDPQDLGAAALTCVTWSEGARTVRMMEHSSWLAEFKDQTGLDFTLHPVSETAYETYKVWLTRCLNTVSLRTKEAMKDAETHLEKAPPFIRKLVVFKDLGPYQLIWHGKRFGFACYATTVQWMCVFRTQLPHLDLRSLIELIDWEGDIEVWTRLIQTYQAPNSIFRIKGLPDAIGAFAETRGVEAVEEWMETVEWHSNWYPDQCTRGLTFYYLKQGEMGAAIEKARQISKVDRRMKLLNFVLQTAP